MTTNQSDKSGNKDTQDSQNQQPKGSPNDKVVTDNANKSGASMDGHDTNKQADSKASQPAAPATSGSPNSTQNSTQGKPQVNVGQDANPKYANMPQVDHSKIQNPEHLAAIKEKIDQDDLLSGKKSTTAPHAVTANEAKAKDNAAYDKDGSDDEDTDDETTSTDDMHTRTSGSSTQRSGVQGSTPHATGSTAKGTDQNKGTEANKAGTLGSGKK